MSSKAAGNFIIIKKKITQNDKGDQKSTRDQGKKALKPPTLSALIKNATRLLGFPEDKPVKCFYDKNGELIEHIGEIEPGMEIFACQDEPEAAFTVPVFVPPSRMQTGFVSQCQARPSPGSPVSPSRAAVSSMSMRQAGMRSSSLMIVADDKNGMTGMSQSMRRSANDLEEDDGNDELRFNEQEEDENRYETTGVSQMELANITGFIPSEIIGTGEDMAKVSTGIVSRIASSANKCEAVHDTVVYKSTQSLIGEIPPHSQCLDVYAQKVVDQCTFCNSFTAFSRFRHAIVGPQQSGKSTFLRILTNATINRMMATGQYRKTLIVSMDFREMEEVLKDSIAMYKEMIRITFKHLTAQKVDVIPFCDCLVAYFEKIPTLDKLVALPNKFTVEDAFRNAVPILAELADNLWQCVHVNHHFTSWITNVVSIPRVIAQAFGFGNVHFVVDHIEVSDFEITPSDPFDKASTVTLIEFMKFMLSNDSFVLSCGRDDNLFGALDGCSNNIDLRNGLQILTVVDLDTEHTTKFNFNLTVNGQRKPIKFREIECGGCSGYLAQWDQLMVLADRLWNEQMKDSSSKATKEMKLVLLGKIRQLAPKVLVQINDETQEPEPLGLIKDFELVNLECNEEEKKESEEEETAEKKD